MKSARVIGSASLVGLLLMGLFAAPGTATHQSSSGRYVAGGTIEGAVIRQCLPEALGYDLGAVCLLPCPTSTCRVTVVDDYRGSEIGFRVCVSGETFCRPQGYWGTGIVSVTPGSLITVAPELAFATMGTASVTGLH